MPIGDRKLSMDELDRTDAAGYARMEKAPLRFVLDDLRSRHNVGSLFRTADAFGMAGIDLCGFTPLPPHREIEKTALGATLSVPWRHFATTLDAIAQLRSEGYQVWAVEQTMQAVALRNWRPTMGMAVALVLGNELNGVDDMVIAACDGCVVIPQSGTKHSLNVSVCGGIVAEHLSAALGKQLDNAG